jgi:hypothetical protein
MMVSVLIMLLVFVPLHFLLSVPLLMTAVEALLTMFPVQAPAVFGGIMDALVKELLQSSAAPQSDGAGGAGGADGSGSQLSEKSLALYAESVCRLCVTNMPAVAAVWQRYAAQAQQDAVPVLIEVILGFVTMLPFCCVHFSFKLVC